MSASDPDARSGWTPPTLPLPVSVFLVVLSVVWIAYTLLIVQQILVGLLVVLLFALAYWCWRVLAALDAIADAQQRRAASAERRERRQTGER